MGTHGRGACRAIPRLVWGVVREASSNWRAAFKRPGTRVSGVKGLALASGSGHPGGGMPLATLSGALAAQALNSEFKQGRRQEVSAAQITLVESNRMDQRKVS